VGYKYNNELFKLLKEKSRGNLKMGLFDKMKEPVFLKESSDAERQLEKLKSLEPLLDSEGKAKLMQDIKFLEYGIAGEKNIAFELKNSHMPMIVLHDIYLEDNDLSAQIDYLVFTRKLCFVIECKNLVGNIEIANTGDFIRTMEFYGKKKKEGIYSPLTQNQRHLELMKKIRKDSRSNIITKFATEKFFEESHKSVVVLANPKTILNAKYAKKEVKNQVIKADQLVAYMKEMSKNSKAYETSDSELVGWANKYLKFHRDVEKDYTAKYELHMINGGNKEPIVQNSNVYTAFQSSSIEDKPVMEEIVKESICDISDKEKKVTFEVPVKTSVFMNIEETPIFKDLKSYRWNKSSVEKIKPYFIYNDNQLKDLISKMPITLDALKTVAGFSDGKVSKYGNDIIEIVKKYA